MVRGRLRVLLKLPGGEHSHDEIRTKRDLLKKMGRLTEVGYVLLSGHGFRGAIPKEVQKMTSVNHLDLR